MKKVWRMCVKEDGDLVDFREHALDSEARLLDSTISKVTQDIDNLRFNTAISQMMICLNGLSKEEGIAKNTAIKFLQLLAPFAPHIAEELYSYIDGSAATISDLPWPEVTNEYSQSDTVKIAVQFNGKLRGEVVTDRDISQNDILEIIKSDTKFSKFLDGKDIVKIIYIPNKIVNIVVK